MKNTPSISICIPTFNRGDLVYSNLSKLLEYTGGDLEVVVIDDASPDNTSELLGTIADPRLFLYRNESNLNFVDNFKEILRKARGDWLFTLSDEDLVNAEIIKNLMDLVRDPAHEDLAVMLGNIRNDEGPYPYYVYHNGSDYVPYRYENRRYTCGDEAVSALGFHHKYISGIMVRRDCIDWGILDCYSREQCGIAPQVDVYTRACVKGSGATFDLDFCIKRVARGQKSFIDQASSDSYKHPKNRMVQFKYYIALADDLIRDCEVKIGTMAAIYGYFIDEATYGWHRILNSRVESDYLFDVIDDDGYDLESGVGDFHSEAVSFMKSVLSAAPNEAAYMDRLGSLISDKLSYFLNKRRIALEKMPD